MDYRPFEDWLLADEQLSPEQQRELQAHLRECAPCAALAEVNLALRSAQAASPLAGFGQRFRVRLAVQRAVQRRRRIWGFSLFGLALLVILSIINIQLLSAWVESPTALFVTWVTWWAVFLSYAHTMQEVVSVFLQSLLGFMPSGFWAALVSSSGTLILLWAFSLWKFTLMQRSSL